MSQMHKTKAVYPAITVSWETSGRFYDGHLTYVTLMFNFNEQELKAFSKRVDHALKHGNINLELEVPHEPED